MPVRTAEMVAVPVARQSATGISHATRTAWAHALRDAVARRVAAIQLVIPPAARKRAAVTQTACKRAWRVDRGLNVLTTQTHPLGVKTPAVSAMILMAISQAVHLLQAIRMCATVRRQE
jgi:hypothetical protein